MALYLTRYLNVPPARIPGESGEPLDDLPTDAKAIQAALLDAFDRQRQVDLAARLAARRLTLGYPPETLIPTLAHAVLREDAGFWRRGSGRSQYRAARTRLGTYSLRLPAIWPHIHRPNARCYRRLTSRGA
jgi:hypothetical protein